MGSKKYRNRCDGGRMEARAARADYGSSARIIARGREIRAEGHEAFGKVVVCVGLYVVLALLVIHGGL